MNDGGPYGPGDVTSPLHLKEEERERVTWTNTFRDQNGAWGRIFGDQRAGTACLPCPSKAKRHTQEAEHVDKIACKQTTDAKNGTQPKLTNLTRRTGPAAAFTARGARHGQPL